MRELMGRGREVLLMGVAWVGWKCKGEDAEKMGELGREKQWDSEDTREGSGVEGSE